MAMARAGRLRAGGTASPAGESSGRSPLGVAVLGWLRGLGAPGGHSEWALAQCVGGPFVAEWAMDP